MQAPAWLWAVFGVLVLGLLSLDLFVHRGNGEVSSRSALRWTGFWVGAALSFGGLIWAVLGGGPASEYLAAWAIEKSLSVDNLFLFVVVFGSLPLDRSAQRRALTWGVLGALVLRGAFVWAGVEALHHWKAISYLFGAVLLIAAVQAARARPQEEGTDHRLVRWLSARLRMSPEQHGSHLFERHNGRRVVTPMLVAIVTIELADIAFAVDSVPAALSVTENVFLAYTSNVFAILGLRALYAVLISVLRNLPYLHWGIAGILGFAGLKMIAREWLPIHPLLSVAIILVILAASVVYSWRAMRRHPEGARRRRTPVEA